MLSINNHSQSYDVPGLKKKLYFNLPSIKKWTQCLIGIISSIDTAIKLNQFYNFKFNYYVSLLKISIIESKTLIMWSPFFHSSMLWVAFKLQYSTDVEYNFWNKILKLGLGGRVCTIKHLRYRVGLPERVVREEKGEIKLP